MTLLALILLCTFAALTIMSTAMFLSGNMPRSVVGGGTIFLGFILGSLETIAAFHLANATGSALVFAAAWVTLAGNIIGLVRSGLSYQKVYTPARGYLWVTMMLNAILTVVFIHGYVSMG